MHLIRARAIRLLSIRLLFGVAVLLPLVTSQPAHASLETNFNCFDYVCISFNVSDPSYRSFNYKVTGGPGLHTLIEYKYSNGVVARFTFTDRAGSMQESDKQCRIQGVAVIYADERTLLASGCIKSMHGSISRAFLLKISSFGTAMPETVDRLDMVLWLLCDRSFNGKLCASLCSELVRIEE